MNTENLRKRVADVSAEKLASFSENDVTKQQKKINPLTARERKAGRIIRKFLLRSRVLLDHLKQDKSILANLPTPKFEKAIHKAAFREQFRTRFHPGRLLEFEALKDTLKQARAAYQKGQQFLVFKPKGLESLPDYQLVDSQLFIDSLTSDGILYNLFPKNEIVESFKGEEVPAEVVEMIAKEITKREGLFVSSHVSEGCYARADIIGCLLRCFGISGNQISKIYFLMGDLNHPDQWVFHVAILLATSKVVDGEEVLEHRILDPTLFPNKSVSITEWTEELAPGSGPKPYFGKPGHGAFDHPGIPCYFTTDCDTTALKIDLSGIVLAPVDSSHRGENLRDLAKMRADQDAIFIDLMLNRFSFEDFPQNVPFSVENSSLNANPVLSCEETVDLQVAIEDPQPRIVIAENER